MISTPTETTTSRRKSIKRLARLILNVDGSELDNIEARYKEEADFIHALRESAKRNNLTKHFDYYYEIMPNQVVYHRAFKSVFDAMKEHHELCYS
ncbi:hypothetical protein A6E01_19585 (plasmid) [Vibrio breoganii]|uniref:Uncharacterized protein n=1 Tax=Vibrio breoganii TaxID=553239 RepID=A0AAN0XZL5_9VIBR|nr:hypothetical protein [Vibrio breoganii]ANO35417.1 hypothetical protein A6E01_19585 [Vibrio breoganii]PML12656.1 hypothetical protein BCT84_01895 [Vibrio breoganii]